MTDYVPPHNREAEEALIGACILNGSMLESVDGLRADDFYYETHGLLYDAIKEQAEKKEPCDVVSLGDAVGEEMKPKIIELATLSNATANAGHYAKIIREQASLRKLVRLGDSIREMAYEGGDPVELASQARELIDNMDKGLEDESRIVSMFEAMMALEERVKNPPNWLEQGAVPTPFTFLDHFYPGRVYILGGYQADGKTAISTQFLTCAARAQKRVAYASIEMSWEDLRDRIVTTFGVPYDEVQSGKVTAMYRDAYEQALTEASVWEVSIIDDPELNVSKLRRIQRRHKYDYLIIDHLHRFDYKERRDIERIVRGIVNIAREFNIPVLLLAQLRRSGDHPPRPTMSMLRESGMIEAEAALVAFIYRIRDEASHLRTGDRAEFIVAKNRFGTESLNTMEFVSQMVRFNEMPDWRAELSHLG